MLEEVKSDEESFFNEIKQVHAKDELAMLKDMQNSEIGTFEHFQPNQPPVLNLDVYLEFLH